MNEIKKYLKNNLPIDDKLHVIGVVSNCCLYDIRYKLASEFIKRMEEEDNIIFYLTELAYGDQEFTITSSDNPRHLQLRTKVPLWHKENLINITIKKLLPKTWKAVAWLDTDIEFENNSWALDTLKLLNKFDIVQMFSRCLYLDNCNNPEQLQQGYVFLDYNGIEKKNIGLNYPHPGYAWACTADFYNRINGLFEYGIVGSGDNYLLKSLYNLENKVISISIYFDDFYKKYFNNVVKQNPKIGYVPVTIKHYYHGEKNNRQYNSRNTILSKNNYDPEKDLTKDENGLLIPTSSCPQKMLDEIFQYFVNRKESTIQSPNINANLLLLSKTNIVKQPPISFTKTSKSKVELTNEEIIGSSEACLKGDPLGFKKAEEIKKEQELKKIEAIKKAEEIKKTQELKKAEEIKKAQELKKERELKRIEELKKAEEIKKLEAEKKAEAIKKAQELKKAEELKKSEAIKKEEELKKYNNKKKAEELEQKKIDDQRRLEITKANELKKALEIKKAFQKKALETEPELKPEPIKKTYKIIKPEDSRKKSYTLPNNPI